MDSGSAMTEMDKLAHLLDHWQSHNEDHANNYRSWAEKAESADRAEAAKLLLEAADATDRITEIFQKALAALK